MIIIFVITVILFALLALSLLLWCICVSSSAYNRNIELNELEKEMMQGNNTVSDKV